MLGRGGDVGHGCLGVDMLSRGTNRVGFQATGAIYTTSKSGNYLVRDTLLASKAFLVSRTLDKGWMELYAPVGHGLHLQGASGKQHFS